VVAVQHHAAGGPYLRSEALSKRTDLAARDAIEGDSLVCGAFYIARPESHLVVEKDRTLS